MKATAPLLLVTWFPRGSEVEITGAILEKKRTSSSNIVLSNTNTFWDARTRGWVSEPGVFELRAGRSSRAIRSTARLVVPPG